MIATEFRQRWAAAQPLLRIAILLIVFVLFNTFVERASDLPEAGYREPVLLWQFVRRLGWLLSIGCIVAVALLARFGGLLAPWTAMDSGRVLRAFVIFLVTLMAWTFSTYGYNYYFDQGYFVERILIVILVPLIWWRPAFVLPFVVLAYLMLWQLAEPALGGSVFPHKLQVLRAINLFAAAFLIFSVTGNRRTDAFVILACCFVAAAYWLPALAKLELSWLTDDRLYVVPLNAYGHGWLAFLPAERVVAFARVIASFDLALRIFVLLIEALCLLFLLRRSVSLALLSALIIFHFGVFAFYGFFFWTWIALDAALFMLLLKLDERSVAAIYNLPVLLVSVVLIGSGAYWAKPPPLGWLETSVTYNYRIEAIDEQGNRVQVHPDFMTPYEDVFTMTGFSYLVPDRATLVGPYGVVFDRNLARSLLAANDPGEVFALEQHSDDRGYDADRAARFYEFLQRYFATRNERGERVELLRILHPPQQFWSFRGRRPDVAVSPIREVIVIEVTTFFDGQKLEEIRERPLARLPIPSSPPP